VYSYSIKEGKGMTTNLDDYRKLLDLIMSEGLAKIEALTDEELRKVMVDE
jgi:hypothetical protein